MSEEAKSVWRKKLARKYPRFLFFGDSTSGYEAWTALTRCPHPQTAHWRCIITTTESEAQAVVDKWAKEKCSSQCQGPAQHSMWRNKF